MCLWPPVTRVWATKRGRRTRVTLEPILVELDGALIAMVSQTGRTFKNNWKCTDVVRNCEANEFQRHTGIPATDIWRKKLEYMEP